jgi:hypothetical protein
MDPRGNNAFPSAHHNDDQQLAPVAFKPPSGFLCPLIHTLLMEPVLSEATGITFECSAIMAWKAVHGDVCPVTGGALGTLVFNQDLQARIIEWRQQQQRAKAIRLHLRRTSANQSAHSAASFMAAAKSKASVFLEEPEDRNKVAPEMYDRILDLVRVHTTCNLQQHASKHQEDVWKPTKKASFESPVKKTAAPSPVIKMAPFQPPIIKPRRNYKTGSIFRNGPTLNVPLRPMATMKAPAADAAPPSFNIKPVAPTASLDSEPPNKRPRRSYPTKSDSIFCKWSHPQASFVPQPQQRGMS